MDFRSIASILAVFLTICSAALPACAAKSRDSRLAAVAATLTHLPENPPEDDPSRGTWPELTTAKHQLRDWIDGLLRTGDFADPTHNSGKSIAAQFRKRLQAGGVSAFGLSAWRSGPMLVVETSYGIVCGTDDSFYGWYWNGKEWVRSFAYERNNYAGEYRPLDLDSLRIASDGQTPVAGFYVLGSSVGTWCTSNWLGRMYQLFHVDGETGKAHLLADRDLWAFVGEGERGTELSADRAVIKYTGDSVDDRKMPLGNKLVMYRLANGHASKVPLAAADAEDFVEQWLSAPRLVGGSALASWWRTFHAYMADRKGSRALWSSTGPAARCPDDPRLWQFSVVFERTPLVSPGHHATEEGPTESHTAYLLIHEDARYRFSIRDIRAKPWKKCLAVTEQ